MDNNFSKREQIEAEFNKYDQLVASQANNHQAWHIRGNLLAQLERYEEAIASYDQAIALKQDDIASWYERGALLSELGKYEEAIASYNQAFQLGHNDAHSWYQHGKSNLALGNVDAALTSFDQALSLQPEAGEVWFAKGEVLLRQNRYGAARLSFNKALKYLPNSAYAWYFYGLTLEQTGNINKALASIDKALTIKERPEFLAERARILQQLQQFDAALANYDRAIQLAPQNDDIWLNRGVLFSDDLEQLPEALACFERAVEIAPDNYLAWCNRGNVLSKLNRNQDALISYEKAIALQPDYDLANYEYDWLVCLMEYQQQPDLSQELARQLIYLTIEQFLDDSVEDEEQIEAYLLERGIRGSDAEDLVVYIPIAFGRAYLLETQAILPTNFVWIDRETEQQKSVVLSEQLIFQLAYDLALEWCKEENYQQQLTYLADWSAEVEVVQQILEQGNRPEDCELSPLMAYSRYKSKE